MGRSKEPKAPEFKNTKSILGNGATVQTYSNGNEVTTKYTPSDSEKLSQKLASDNLNAGLESLNSSSQGLLDYYKELERAYVQDASKKFTEQFETSYNNLKEDIAKRFGSLNSSNFMSQLNNLQSAKASGLADVINQGKQYSYDIAQQNQEQIRNNVKSMYDIVNQDLSNYLSSIKQQNSMSLDLNKLFQDQYADQLENYTSQVNNKSDNKTDLMKNIFDNLTKIILKSNGSGSKSSGGGS